MKQNNKKNTWKAVVAVVMVMTMLFTMSSLVNASIIEWFFDTEYDEIITYSSSNGGHAGSHFWIHTGKYSRCTVCKMNKKIYMCAISQCPKTSVEQCNCK